MKEVAKKLIGKRVCVMLKKSGKMIEGTILESNNTILTLKETGVVGYAVKSKKAYIEMVEIAAIEEY